VCPKPNTGARRSGNRNVNFLPGARGLDFRTREALERQAGFDPDQVRELLELIAPVYRGHGRQNPEQYRHGRGWSNLQAEDWGRKRFTGAGLFRAHATGGKFAIAALSPDYAHVITLDLDAGADLEARYRAVCKTLGDPSAVVGTPGGGVHCHYIGTEARRTETFYPLLVAKLQAAGVEVAPGKVEVFPRPTKPGARRALLRVPFVAFRWVADAGADLATGRMLDTGTLEPLHTQPAEGVALFVAARRRDWVVLWELEKCVDLHDTPRRPRYQGGRPLDLDNVERLRATTTPADADITRQQYTGEDFARVAAALEAHGLQGPGQRHHAGLILGRWWFMRGLATTPEVAGALAVAWLRSRHNGASSTFNRNPAAALDDFRLAAEWGAATTGQKKHAKKPPGRRKPHQVTEADVRHLSKRVRALVPRRSQWRATVAMAALLEHLAAEGRRLLPIGKSDLISLPGWSGGTRGTYADNVELAAAVGLWELEAEAVWSMKRTRRRARQWRILWRFRGPRAPFSGRACFVPRKKNLLSPPVYSQRAQATSPHQWQVATSCDRGPP